MGSGLGLLSWVLVGALAGIMACVITRTHRPRCGAETILVGIVGACLGGGPFAVRLGFQTTFDWHLSSFALATLGALVLVVVWCMERRI